MLRKSSRLMKSRNDVEEIPDTQEIVEPEEDTQWSVDQGFESEWKESRTNLEKAGDDFTGFHAALSVHRLGHGKSEQEMIPKNIIRSTSKVNTGIANHTTAKSTPSMESPSQDFQMEEEMGDLVGWDHTGYAMAEGTKIQRIRNMLPPHQVERKSIYEIDEESQEPAAAPPSSHPRSEVSDSADEEFQPIKSPDRANKKLSTFHRSPSFARSQALTGPQPTSQPPSSFHAHQPSTQSPSISKILSKSQSQARHRQKSVQLETQSYSKIQQPSFNADKAIAQTIANSIEGFDESPVYEWDTSMSKEEFYETMKAAELAERKYGGSELQEYKELERAESPQQIKTLIHRLEYREAEVTALSKVENQNQHRQEIQTLSMPEQPISALAQTVSQLAAWHELLKSSEENLPAILQKRRFSRDLDDFSGAIGLTMARTGYRRSHRLVNIVDEVASSDSGWQTESPREVRRATKRTKLEDETRIPTKLAAHEIIEDGVDSEKSAENNEQTTDRHATKRSIDSQLSNTSQKEPIYLDSRMASKLEFEESDNDNFQTSNCDSSRNPAVDSIVGKPENSYSGEELATANVKVKGQESVTITPSQKSPKRIDNVALATVDAPSHSTLPKRKRDIEDEGQEFEALASPNGGINKEARKAAKKQRHAKAKKERQTINLQKNAEKKKEQAAFNFTNNDNSRIITVKKANKEKSTASEDGSNASVIMPDKETQLLSAKALTKSERMALSKGRQKATKGDEELAGAATVDDSVPTILKPKSKSKKRKRKQLEETPISEVKVGDPKSLVISATEVPKQTHADTGELMKKRKKHNIMTNKQFETSIGKSQGLPVGGAQKGAELLDATTEKNGNMLVKETTLGIGQDLNTEKTTSGKSKAFSAPKLETKSSFTSINRINNNKSSSNQGTRKNSEKRKHSKRARAANAGLGREYSMKNPFNTLSEESSNHQKSEITKQENENSPSSENLLSRPATKKARRVSFHEDVGVMTSVPSKIHEKYQHGLGKFTTGGVAAQSTSHRSLENLKAGQDTVTSNDSPVGENKETMISAGKENIESVTGELHPKEQFGHKKSRKSKNGDGLRHAAPEGNARHL